MTDNVLIDPPAAIEAECSVLGGLLLHPASLHQVSDYLADDDFFRADHRLIYRAIKALVDQSGSCDVVTICEWLTETSTEQVVSAGYVIGLANSTPSAANINAWADIVVEKSQLRKLVEVGTRLASAALKPGQSSAQLVAIANQHLAAMAAARIRGGLHSVRAAVSRLWVEMGLQYEQKRKDLLGLPSPWTGFDKFTKGLRDGQLYVVGARPSMGKSAFAGQLAAYTAINGQRAAFFAVEGSEKELLQRTFAAFGEVPFEYVEQPQQGDEFEKYWDRLTEVKAKLMSAPLLVDDTPYIRIEQLVARARREHQRAPLRLVVIDHLHDMDFGLGDSHKVRMEIGRAAAGAKALAKDLNCPVVLLAQLNRGSADRADKRPMMKDLRESGEIEQKADVIVFLHREDYYDTAEHSTHLQGVVELIPAKGRNLRLGKPIHLKNEFECMRMTDWIGPLPKPKSATDGEGGSSFKNAAKTGGKKASKAQEELHG